MGGENWEAVGKKSSKFAPIATRLALCICNFWSPLKNSPPVLSPVLNSVSDKFSSSLLPVSLPGSCSILNRFLSSSSDFRQKSELDRTSAGESTTGLFSSGPSFGFCPFVHQFLPRATKPLTVTGPGH